MPGVSFVLHRSNALESLADRLAEVVAQPVGPPSQPEVLVVQSRGMERWVSQHLARRLGVWANARFLFPRDLVERVLGQVLGDARESPDVGQAFSRESLTWGVAALLPGLMPLPAFAPLATYLEGDAGGVRRLQLARRIGDLLDQYVVYRPEVIGAWERGEEDDWQAVLWRALVGQGHGRHLADRAGECIARLAKGEVDLGDLPARVTLFGISTLPPLFLRVLGGISAHLDVHLLQLSPCQEYWADLRAADARPDLSPPGSSDAQVTDAQVTDANPLLASLGKVGRDFQMVLTDLDDVVGCREAAGDLYRDPLDRPVAPTVLARLQSDILHQRRRSARGGASDPALAPVPVAPEDDSLTVHTCHGPMREAEVLRDQLLGLFDSDPTLEPRHVLVMTPDIETYAPYVDAALGATATIPYTIADRSLRQEHPVVEGFCAVLDVVGSRFGATAVVDLLGHAAVRERFGLADQDVDAARQWINDASICWGVDAQHRQELGLPPYEENTWRFGLDRLVLAHAMPPDGRTLFAGTLPCGAVVGDQAGSLGPLVDLCETLFDLRTRLAEPRPVAAWRDVLVEVLDRTVSAEAEPLQHQLVRDGLERLADQARAAGFDDPVALDAIGDELTSGFDEAAGSAGFLTGGVTVCELLPMRSIPFRVIALVGMNDDAFPRLQRRLGFDRMGHWPLPGDRSPRDDDRYQLLECLLAARERLLITYVGQSSRDNSPLPPSVVVSEVLDTVAESCLLAEGEDVRERFVVRHPLQPFSPRYFDPTDDPRLFSFDAAQALGAARLQATREPPAPFVTRLALPEPPGDLSLDRVLRFFDHPARAFLAGPLGLVLGGEVTHLEDREPMALDGLARWQIGARLLDEALRVGGDPEWGGGPAREGGAVREGGPAREGGAAREGGPARGDPADLYPALRADGVLPLGWPGRLAFEAMLPGVDALREALDRWLTQPDLPALRVDVSLGTTRLTGWLRGLRAGAQLRYRYGRVRARDKLAAWIHHLALCAMGPRAEGREVLPDTTVLVGRAAKKAGQAEVHHLERLSAPEARDHLATLVSLYEAGQRIPLRIFPEPSLAYAQVMHSAPAADAAALDVARAAALDAARRAFTSTHRTSGDDADVYVRQAHAGADDLLATGPAAVEDPGLAFSDLAVAVYGPLVDHLQGGT